MGSVRKTEGSSKRVIVATLAIVVAAFLGSTGFAEYRAMRSHALTAEIATDTSPSIMHLAAARAELRDLQRLLNTQVLLASNGQPTSTKPLTEVRGRLRGNLQTYFSLPTLPGERELWRRIDAEMVDVDVIAGRILELTAARRYSEARQLLVGTLPAAIEEESEAIISAIELNASRVRQVADRISGEQRSRMLWVAGLDGLSVGLAVLLAWLALRTVTAQERLTKLRSEELEGFAGRVAHDLLNPIAAADLSLAAAERTDPDQLGGRRAGLLSRSRRSLERARQLIDDLLSFAQAGARPELGAVAPVDEVVDGVVEELRPPATASAIEMGVVKTPLPLAVRCASGVLASLLSNLLRNAIKHMGDSPRRQITLRVSRVDGRVRFEVEDTGPGIEPELQAHVFDPYVRGRGTVTPGLGLGLATVRRLVEGHDGRYGVSSRLGQGALFWFELPGERLYTGPSRGPGTPLSRPTAGPRDVSAPHQSPA
jgi:signal transduction histidine kinase